MPSGFTTDTQTVLSLLQTSAEHLKSSSRSARLDAELLLAHALGWERARLYSDSDQTVPPEIVQGFEALVAERHAGRPVAQMVGSREFWSLELAVTPDALVPRPETELLVECALNRIPPGTPGSLLDLGTGTGAVALALASERPDVVVTATDLSEEALKVARYNAERHGLAVEFRFGDWFHPVADDHFTTIVSNPPYVADQEWMLRKFELGYEPAMALRAGRDGLMCLKQIVNDAMEHLLPGGWLLVEHGFRQGPAAMRLFQEAGFTAVSTYRDLPGRPRVTEGQRPVEDD